MRIKICCIQSIDEARLAIEAGADALGLVSYMPSGPGVISENTIREIAEWVPEGIDTFLLTSLQSANEIIRQHRRCRTRTIQLVDRLTGGSYATLRSELPAIKLVQVLHVTGEETLREATEIQNEVDALLLDSGRPDAQIKELGGTGRTHNWDISAEIVRTVKLPVYLAGGLNAGNVSAAVKFVRPFGVDVCSGVRTNGKLDQQKLNQFCHRLRSIA